MNDRTIFLAPLYKPSEKITSLTYSMEIISEWNFSKWRWSCYQREGRWRMEFQWKLTCCFPRISRGQTLCDAAAELARASGWHQGDFFLHHNFLVEIRGFLTQIAPHPLRFPLEFVCFTLSHGDPLRGQLLRILYASWNDFDEIKCGIKWQGKRLNLETKTNII